MDAWLVGTGPSLDTYDWTKADGYILCVNFSYKVVPRFNALCVMDTHRIGLFSDLYDQGIPLYTQRARTMCKRHFNVKSPGYIVPGVGFCSSGVGLCTLKNMAFKRVHMVGYDSLNDVNPTHDHAQSLVKLGLYNNNPLYKPTCVVSAVRLAIESLPELEIIHES